MTTMEQISTNDTTEISHFAITKAIIQEQNTLKPQNSHNIGLLLYYGTSTLFLVIGFMVNYKLFDNVRKETHGDSGKVLQWIVKTYALIQAICVPCVFLAWIIFLKIVRAYDGLLNPCIIMYTSHILIIAHLYLRLYLSLNSLILATGRYAFVVQHERVLRFGQIKLGKILVWSSFIIPLVTSLLALSVVSVEYNGWFGELKKYDRLCSVTHIDHLISNTTDERYRSPIFNLAHSILPSSAMYCMYVVLGVTSFILYSNVTEGIVYVRSAIFVIR